MKENRREKDFFHQSAEKDEFRYFSPEWLEAMAQGLTTGAKEHPGETWHKISTEEHAWRAVRHLVLYLSGDRSDTHLVNASMRCMMAFATAAAEAEHDNDSK